MSQRLLGHLLGVAMVTGPVSVGAAEPAMEHVLITVPIHKREAETALPVTVLSGTQLRDSAAASIGQTLAGRPGITSASFGAGVGHPVIRGHQGPRVKVLQNGTGSLDASRVSADHAVSVEPMLANSIEVLRGPATLLYGGGAIGGVVNVIDNRIPSSPLAGNRAELELRHGSGADEDTAVFLGEAATGTLNWHVSGVYRDRGLVEIPGASLSDAALEHDHDEPGHEEPEGSRGYLANSDGRSHQVTVGGSWTFDRGYLGLAVSQLENEYGIPPGGHGGHDDDDHDDHDDHGDADHIRLAIEQTRVDLAGEYHPDGLVEALRARITFNDYEHSEIEGTGEIGTVFDNEGWEGRFELVHGELAGWHGVVGLQVQRSDFSALGEESFIPPSELRGAGLFFVEDYHHGDWTYELGLRLDRDSIDTRWHPAVDFTSVSGSVSALWDITESWSLGVAGSRSERAPATEELFSNVGNTGAELVTHGATQSIEIGDVDLDTEIARNLDLNLRWRPAGWDLSAALFYNDFRDYIHLANTGEAAGGSGEDVPVLYYQQQDAEFYGVEYEAAMPTLSTAWGDLQLSVYGDMIRGELADGSDVPRMPPRRVGVRADFETGPVRAFVDLMDAAGQDRSGLNESSTDGYTRLDVGVNYHTSLFGTGADLFLQGRNLTDEDIRNSTSLLRDVAPEPGRSLIAGLRLAF